MVEYTLTEFAAVAGGRVVGPDGGVGVRAWVYDSRLPFDPAGACFLALDGPRRSGFAYVEELLRGGVVLFCVGEHHASGGLPAGATFVVVRDVLAALQALAAHRRARYRGRVVGITGSNGKTIVKEWLYGLLGGSTAGVYRSPGSANSQLGVPLSVLAIPASAETAILEVGISREGEMAALAGIAAPLRLGIFTNLGGAHDAGFPDRDAKAREKLSLFAGARELVYRAEGEGGRAVERFLAAAERPPAPRAWSATATDSAAEVGYRAGELLVRRPGEAGPGAFPLAYADGASRENLAHALVAARGLGVDDAALRARAADLPHPIMRLRAFRGRGGCQVIDDTYSADREGLAAAVAFFAQHRLPRGPSIAVLGPLRESGLAARALRRAVAAVLAPARFSTVLTVGEELAGLGGLLDAETAHRHFATPGALSRALAETDLRGASLLVKGPRDLRLERVADALRASAHDLRLEIDLDALTDNLAAFRRRLRPATRICVMVKAHAYGSGSPELARLLAARGVDYLAVASVDEGEELRRAGSRLPVIVADASGASRERLAEFALEPEVTSLDRLRELGRGGSPPLPVHLKVDTGMHRLGFAAAGPELAALCAELAGGGYRVASVFSHLAAADDPSADDFTLRQYGRLLAAADRVDAAVGARVPRHLLNSAGAWRLPGLQLDMVRLGIGLYGAGLPAALAASGELRRVHRWVATLVRVRTVPAGEPVGYGLRGAAARERRVGVVNVGYADGLRRAAGEGAVELFVRGRPCPTIGSVCMDFCMVDLAASPGAVAGDEVELFGEHQGIEALAAAYDTIPYEVFTGIGSRVRRVYYR